ncbi:MAG: low molecular weight phosphotyrosine protein phosphatase [Flavobacteriales bacterium]|jgi:protein-tyrosine phosphatase|nr:low molecular weight phosphotyrosine protein phosphatase [Flavobacteriales bacterium]MBT6815007.1 low molecular weight phosphotyrosine protein phosphatase [Flavobacteriales bacterium]MBT7620293.1 low molecular weight phosphotyrosine protein phosphatase [Flavobacteriales bacterium]MBT7726927.1 low molecular weight phosphotyrosine protein phosphatase [Flavobacteriales bacterium]
MKILMVCLGNICRSPLAEGILKNKTQNLDVFVDSAGTSSYHVGNLPDSRSIEIANKNGIDLTYQRARQFSEKDFDDFDKIYAMDTNNYSNIISLGRNQSDRDKVDVILNELTPKSYDSVPDPYYGAGDGFQIVYNMLDNACDAIVGKL